MNLWARRIIPGYNSVRRQGGPKIEWSALDLEISRASYVLADADYPTPGRVWGIDISHWTGIVSDWDKVKASGCSFVIIKFLHGKNETNCAVANWLGAINAEIPVWAYQWLLPSRQESANGQARAYIEMLNEYPCQMPAFVDFEYSPFTYKDGGSAKTVVPELSDLESHLSVFEAESDFVGGIYTGPYYWREHGSPDAKWKNRVLWLANYPSAGQPPLLFPDVPAPWAPDCSIWQWSENGDGDLIGTAPGERRVDMNYFMGDQAAFDKFVLDGTYTPPGDEPTQGDYMYKVTATGTVNLRDNGNDIITLATDIGDFAAGQVGFGNEVRGGPDQAYYCLKLDEIDGVAMTRETWVYLRHGGANTKAVIEQIADPEPTDDPVTITVEHQGKFGSATIFLK